MNVYYNENDPFAVRWLRNLIAKGSLPDGDVDERSIEDVKPEDVAGYDQCHFFAGIGGWAVAVDLAGWEGPIWTGSCPCQPFSVAGRRRGAEDPRHLWPVWLNLIAKIRPVVVVGEQVAGANAWLDGVAGDLEDQKYTFGAVVLGAHTAGAPHRRQRLWWCGVGNADGGRQRIVYGENERASRQSGSIPAVADTKGADVGGAEEPSRQEGRRMVDGVDGAGVAVADTDSAGSQGRVESGSGYPYERNPWSCSSAPYHCQDGKYRQAPTERILHPLADGLPESVDGGGPISRTGAIKGAGNAIVPQVGAMFLRAIMEEM